jgi:hypothetical protein
MSIGGNCNGFMVNHPAARFRDCADSLPDPVTPTQMVTLAPTISLTITVQ